MASHDRSFMEGLDRLFVLRGDGVVRLFEGSYSEVTSCPLYVVTFHCCNQELPRFSQRAQIHSLCCGETPVRPFAGFNAEVVTAPVLPWP